MRPISKITSIFYHQGKLDYYLGHDKYTQREPGISLENTNFSLIEENTCNFNAYGIVLNRSHNNTISQTRCLHNALDGIYLDHSANNTFAANDCAPDWPSLPPEPSSNPEITIGWIYWALVVVCAVGIGVRTRVKKRD